MHSAVLIIDVTGLACLFISLSVCRVLQTQKQKDVKRTAICVNVSQGGLAGVLIFITKVRVRVALF